jgi:FAD-dependent urate hydroxylase
MATRHGGSGTLRSVGAARSPVENGRYSSLGDTMDQLKVIIVGAGMGGLTAAIALRQAGYQIEVYDRVPALTAAGAGVSLWSNGVKVLNRLGLGPQIAAIGGQMDRMMYRGRDGTRLTDFSLQALVDAVGQRPYPVARTDLQRMLLDAVGAASVRLGCECVGVEQDAASATAIFANGHRSTGDLVVGADGTHSIVRGSVLEAPASRQPVGYVNWNGLVTAGPELVPPSTWVTFVGEHKRVALMPVGGGRHYFFFDVPLPAGTPPHPGGAKAELSRHFVGWAAPVQALIEQLEERRINRIEIHDIEPLPRMVRGRIALLGDAGHTSAPDLGQGGCQAMEDAWVLAHQLLTTNVSVSDALARYEAQRLRRTGDIVLKARKRSNVTHGKEPTKTAEWYDELALEDGRNIIKAIAATILDGPL